MNERIVIMVFFAIVGVIFALCVYVLSDDGKLALFSSGCILSLLYGDAALTAFFVICLAIRSFMMFRQRQ